MDIVPERPATSSTGGLPHPSQLPEPSPKHQPFAFDDAGLVYSAFGGRPTAWPGPRPALPVCSSTRMHDDSDQPSSPTGRSQSFAFDDAGLIYSAFGDLPSAWPGPKPALPVKHSVSARAKEA